MSIKALKKGYAQAKAITKKFAKTFYLASLFLPKDKKYASYTVYAICRLSDEAVDLPSCANQSGQLQNLERNIACAYGQNEINDPLLAAFRQTINHYKIPKEYFDQLISGMRQDLTINHYPDFLTLQDYCYKAAGVVGLMMLKIFGYKNEAATGYAVKLGIAMQLTNILRDINEDLARKRVYLPEDEMLRFNITQAQLLNQQNDENFKNFMRFQIDRCTELYEESLPGIKLINSRICRLVVCVMKEVYSGILESIENNHYDIFTRRATVGKLKKIQIIFAIIKSGKYL